MKILIIYSGSIGHLNGVLDLFNYSGLIADKRNLFYYASHISVNHALCGEHIGLSCYPAFLNFEFMISKNSLLISRLKREKVIWKKRNQELLDLVESILPDLIFIDTFNATDILLLKSAECIQHSKILFFETKLSTVLMSNSSYGCCIGRQFVKVNGYFLALNQSFKKAIYKFIFPYYDDHYQAKQLYAKSLFKELQLDWNRLNVPSVVGAPELVLSNVDMNDNRLSHQLFFGICKEIHKRRHVGPLNILVSAGSRYYRKDLIEKFWRMINYLASTFQFAHFYIPESHADKKSAENLFLYSWEEYHVILKSSRIHINHGGINSLKDSIAYMIPMLICPLDLSGDQVHTSLVLHDLGIAQIWNIFKDSEKSLENKIHMLLTDMAVKSLEDYIETNYESADSVRQRLTMIIDNLAPKICEL